MKKQKSMQCPSDINRWIEEDEVSVLFERVPNKFIVAEAKAASLDFSKKEAKEKAKKRTVKTQGGQ